MPPKQRKPRSVPKSSSSWMPDRFAVGAVLALITALAIMRIFFPEKLFSVENKELAPEELESEKEEFFEWLVDMKTEIYDEAFAITEEHLRQALLNSGSLFLKWSGLLDSDDCYDTTVSIDPSLSTKLSEASFAYNRVVTVQANALAIVETAKVNEYIYHSQNLENIRITSAATADILNNTSLPPNLHIFPYDIATTLLHRRAIRDVYNAALNYSQPIDTSFFSAIHEIIFNYNLASATQPGTFRSYPLTKDFERVAFPEGFEIPAIMAGLSSWSARCSTHAEPNPPGQQLPSVLFAAELLRKFEHIWPFENGNGLVARILFNAVLVREGFPWLIVVREQDKKEYGRVVRSKEKEEFYNLMLGGVIKGLEEYIEALKK